MSKEFPDPAAIAVESAGSLYNRANVNGLAFRAYGFSFAVRGEGVDDIGSDEGAEVPTMFLYYPAGIVMDKPFSAGVQLDAGNPVTDEAIRAAIEYSSSQQVLHHFIKSSGVAAVVDFTRAAFYEKRPLLECRNSLLRQHQAPLAAVAVRSTVQGYEGVALTPYFVWPWAAVAEMQHFIQED